jgi:hypothetical protein
MVYKFSTKGRKPVSLPTNVSTIPGVRLRKRGAEPAAAPVRVTEASVRAYLCVPPDRSEDNRVLAYLRS